MADGWFLMCPSFFLVVAHILVHSLGSFTWNVAMHAEHNLATRNAWHPLIMNMQCLPSCLRNASHDLNSVY